MSREIKLVLEFGRTPNDGEWVVDRTNEATSLDGTTTYDSNPDLWFKIDGISFSQRDDYAEAIIGNNSTDFGADSYNYTDDSVVYKLKKNLTSLIGGVEVAWDLNPRDLTDGYGYDENYVDIKHNGYYSGYDENKLLHPAAYMKEFYKDPTTNKLKYYVVKVNLPVMGYRFQSERDIINVNINHTPAGNTQSKAVEDDLDIGSLDQNYYWKRVCTEMQVYTKTRALSDRKYSIELKKSNVDALGGEDAVYVRVGSQYIKIKNNPAVSIVNIHGEDVYQIDVTEQNKAWYEWLTSNARNAETENSYNYANNSDFSVYLGVKKEVINSLSDQDKTDGKDTIKVYAHAERKYNDEDEWFDGDIPNAERGDKNPNWIDKHRAEASYKFAKPNVSGEVGTQKDIIGYREYIPDTVSSGALSSGKHLSFILSASTKNIVQTNDNNDSVDVPYNLVIEDDQTFVMTDMPETDVSQYNKYYPYRDLEDSEYYLASITLPKYSVSGRSITGNDTETSIHYAVYTLDNNTPIQSGTLSADNETYISLPAGVYRHVKIKLEKVTGSLKTFSPKLEYVFNLSQPFRSGKTKDDATENKDPYGRLVNLSRTYVEILDNDNSVSGYIGIDKTTVESNRNNKQTAYSYYQYSTDSTGLASGDFAYSDSDRLQTTYDNNIYLYPIRDEAAVRICDPSIKLWTDTEYYMKDKRFLDRSKYYENGDPIPNENEEDKKYEFYSKIKSTAYFESDEDANITSFTVYTAVPDWLEIDYNDFTITKLENMTISENGTERKLTANDLYDVATSGTGSSFRLDSSAPYS